MVVENSGWGDRVVVLQAEGALGRRWVSLAVRSHVRLT